MFKDKSFSAYVVLVCFVLALVCYATSSPAQEKKSEPAKAAEPIKVAPEAALRIRDAQLRLMQANAQLQAVQSEFQNAVVSAFVAAKLDQTKYQIDDQKWVFIPVPEQAKPEAPKPETPKK